MFKRFLNFIDDIRRYFSFNILVIVGYLLPVWFNNLYRPHSQYTGAGLAYWLFFTFLGIIAFLFLIFALFVNIFERKFSLKIKNRIFDYLFIMLFQIVGICIFLYYFLFICMFLLMLLINLIPSFFK